MRFVAGLHPDQLGSLQRSHRFPSWIKGRGEVSGKGRETEGGGRGRKERGGSPMSEVR